MAVKKDAVIEEVKDIEDITVDDLEDAKLDSTEGKYEALVVKGEKGSNGNPLISKGSGYELTLNTK